VTGILLVSPLDLLLKGLNTRWQQSRQLKISTLLLGEGRALVEVCMVYQHCALQRAFQGATGAQAPALSTLVGWVVRHDEKQQNLRWQEQSISTFLFERTQFMALMSIRWIWVVSSFGADDVDDKITSWRLGFGPRRQAPSRRPLTEHSAATGSRWKSKIHTGLEVMDQIMLELLEPRLRRDSAVSSRQQARTMMVQFRSCSKSGAACAAPVHSPTPSKTLHKTCREEKVFRRRLTGVARGSSGQGMVAALHFGPIGQSDVTIAYLCCRCADISGFQHCDGCLRVDCPDPVDAKMRAEESAFGSENLCFRWLWGALVAKLVASCSCAAC
jgi:hypothetical protein